MVRNQEMKKKGNSEETTTEAGGKKMKQCFSKKGGPSVPPNAAMGWNNIIAENNHQIK